ncbi:MAG TPA: Ku protein, partial [Methylocystis sp.]
EATALHQIHKPSGKRVRYEKVVPGVGAIEASDIVKGFEINDDSYVVLEPEELEEIKLESSRAVELAQFVDRAEIDPRYFEKPYYVVPEGDVSTEGFIVIREALTSTGKVGLGKLTMRGREDLVAVMPFGKGLVLETLRYQSELRAADPSFADIPDLKVDKEMIELATELIRRRSRPFDPTQFRDAYAEALKQLVERKRAGRAIITTGEEERCEPGKIINLIEALKKSVGQDGPRRPPTERGRGGAKNAPEPRGSGRSKSTGRSGKTSPAKRRA